MVLVLDLAKVVQLHESKVVVGVVVMRDGTSSNYCCLAIVIRLTGTPAENSMCSLSFIVKYNDLDCCCTSESGNTRRYNGWWFRGG